jgi:hypothetical protein
MARIRVKLAPILPRLKTCAIQFLGEATLFQKLLLKLAELLVEKIVGLVDQADERVCRDFRLSLFNIGLICPIGPITGIDQLSDRVGGWMVFVPESQAALSQKVLVVEQQLFETRPRDVNQFEFGFFGSPRSHAAFGDVLFAAARGLHHLVMSPRSAVYKPVAKPNCCVVDDLRILIRLQFTIAAVRRDQARMHLSSLVCHVHIRFLYSSFGGIFCRIRPVKSYSILSLAFFSTTDDHEKCESK